MSTEIQQDSSRAERLRQQLAQPSALPESVRQQWFSQTGESIVLYAMVDLDEKFQLTERWLILGLHTVGVVGDQGSLRIFARSAMGRVQEFSGLSSNRLVVYGSQDSEEILLIVRYTHRQMRAVGLIRFVLEQGGGAEVADQADRLYQKNVLHAVEEAQASVNARSLTVVWRLLSYLAPYRRQVIWGMGGAFAMTLIGLVPAFLAGYIIDHVIRPFQDGRLQINEAKHLAWVTIAALFATYILKEAFAYVRLKTMSTLGEFVAKDLRDDVFRHMQKLSLSFFSSKQTGSIISRVTSDTDRLWDFIAFGVVEVSTSVMTLLGLAIVLNYLDWRLGLWVTVPVPFLLWAIAKHGQRMQLMFLRVWRKWSALTDVLSDSIPGIRVVKAFHRHDYETARFVERNQKCLDSFNDVHEVWTRFWPGLMLVISVIVTGVWAIGVPRVLSGELSAGVFVSFALYMTMFVQPIEIIGQMARMVNRATSSAMRVFEVLDTEPQILEQENAVVLGEVQGRVEFKDVNFSYDGVRKVIRDLNFTIQPGEMIGLVGPSGGGKTTVTNLLARFFEVQSGEIRIDGVPLKSLDLSSYRSQLGMVLQDPYLFHGSILDNIRYSRPSASLEDVIAAAKAANSHDFICALSQGYDTTVGERGLTLSGGERQRVSIARAILSNPRILILDEATSAVDTEGERKIQEALDRLIKGRTVIAIAHRLSTLAKANRILVIEGGKLAEQGTHRELLRVQGGIYKKLVEMQQRLHSAEGFEGEDNVTYA